MTDNEERKEGFYSNREIYEFMLEIKNSLKEDVDSLKKDLHETQTIIRKYNGLRKNQGELQEKQVKLRKEVDEMKNTSNVKSGIAEGFKSWGIYVVMILSLIITFLSITGVIG
jgi:DNA-binding transcriptional regulator GbsR (MarR family)